MAFSNRFPKAKSAPAPPPATKDEDSDEVESVEADEDASGRQKEQQAEVERLRKMKEDEDAARAKAFAEAQEQAAAKAREQRAAEEAAKKKAAEEAARRRAAADEARKKAEEDRCRKEEYEYEKARQETIARSKKEAAKRFGGSGGGGFGAGGGGFGGGGGGGGGGSFSWKKSTQPQASGFGAAAQKPDPRRRDLPSHDECEMGISAMISRTSNGMKEGLQMLGLPNFPLTFIPGQCLDLCGHNLREEINEMIHAWMTDEKDDFYGHLLKIKDITSKPILTQEEMGMMDNPHEWVEISGPDGKPRFTKKDHAATESAPAAKVDPAPAPKAEEESDDEVIDIVPGSSMSTAKAAPPAPAARPAPAAPAFKAPAAGGSEDDYYALLGVAPTSTLQEIRTSFRSLVVTQHPEKGGDPKKFQKLNKAYSVLSDQKKRQEYDASRGGTGAAARPKQFVD